MQEDLKEVHRTAFTSICNLTEKKNIWVIRLADKCDIYIIMCFEDISLLVVLDSAEGILYTFFSPLFLFYFIMIHKKDFSVFEIRCFSTALWRLQ